jgi:hypothetical protein
VIKKPLNLTAFLLNILEHKVREEDAKKPQWFYINCIRVKNAAKIKGGNKDIVLVSKTNNELEYLIKSGDCYDDLRFL